MIGDWLFDLFGALALTAAAAFAVFALTGPIRAVLVLPVVLFVPGYVVLAALYPRRVTDGRDGSRGFDSRIGPDGIRYVELGPAERFSLSLALSLATVGMLAFVLNFVTGLYARPLIAALASVVGLFTVIAALRRSGVPTEERARLPIPTRTKAPLNWTFVLFMALSLVVLAGSGALATFTSPTDGDFTELYVTGQNPDGDWTTQAADDAAAAGETVRIGIGNDEGSTEEYTVVVVAESVTDDGDVSGRNIQATEQVTVPDGETGTVEYSGGGGGANRLVFYLYLGDAPENPSPDSAYRVAQVWLG